MSSLFKSPSKKDINSKDQSRILKQSALAKPIQPAAPNNEPRALLLKISIPAQSVVKTILISTHSLVSELKEKLLSKLSTTHGVQQFSFYWEKEGAPLWLSDTCEIKAYGFKDGDVLIYKARPSAANRRTRAASRPIRVGPWLKAAPMSKAAHPHQLDKHASAEIQEYFATETLELRETPEEQEPEVEAIVAANLYRKSTDKIEKILERYQAETTMSLKGDANFVTRSRKSSHADHRISLMAAKAVEMEHQFNNYFGQLSQHVEAAEMKISGVQKILYDILLGIEDKGFTMAEVKKHVTTALDMIEGSENNV